LVRQSSQTCASISVENILSTLDLRPIYPIRYCVDFIPEFFQQRVSLAIFSQDRIKVSRWRFGGLFLFLLGVICGLLGYCEFTGVPWKVSLWRWRNLVESIENSFAKDVVAVFERLALLGSQVVVCQFESVSPATVREMSVFGFACDRGTTCFLVLAVWVKYAKGFGIAMAGMTRSISQMKALSRQETGGLCMYSHKQERAYLLFMYDR